MSRSCPDCHVRPGQPHDDGCDMALCTACGEQRITCKHRASDTGWGQIWNGPAPTADAPLVLPRATVESLHHLLGQLLGEEDRTQSSTVEGDGTCTATLKDLDGQVIRCAQPAGHYDGDKMPEPLAEGDDPGGWHRSAPDASGNRVTWSDWATGATPHKETP